MTTLLAALLLAVPLVNVQVTPSVGFAPLNVKVTLTQRVEDAREVCLTLNDTEEPDFEQVNCWPPDFTTKDVRLNALHEGLWRVSARVRDSKGEWIRGNTVTVDVRGAFPGAGVKFGRLSR